MLLDFHHHHHKADYYGIYNESLHDHFVAKKYSVGLHPKDISVGWEQTLDQMSVKMAPENCLSIGECGLDALVETPLEEQLKVFNSQITIAEQLRKPLTIHCVRRYNEVIQACKGITVAKVIHGFNKRNTIAKQLLENGFHLSFGISLLNNLSLQKIFQEVPNSRFFLETDTANIPIDDIYHKAAELKNMSVESVAEIIDENLKTIMQW